MTANGVVYVTKQNDFTEIGNLYAFDASTGSLLWQYTSELGMGGSMTVANGVVYASDAAYVYAFGLPSHQWSKSFSPPERPDPTRLQPDWKLKPSTE